MHDIITIVLWVLALWYATIPLFWLMIHPFAGYWRQRSGSPYKLLGPAWGALVVVVGLLTWPFVFVELYSTPMAWLLGAVMIFCAITIYRSARKHFGPYVVSGKVEMTAAHTQPIIDAGIHGKIRHPLYAGHALFLSGLATITGSAAVFILLTFALITGPILIITEERELEARFGESFRQYKRRVPAMIPHLGEKSANREVRG